MSKGEPPVTTDSNQKNDGISPLPDEEDESREEDGDEVEESGGGHILACTHVHSLGDLVATSLRGSRPRPTQSVSSLTFLPTRFLITRPTQSVSSLTFLPTSRAEQENLPATIRELLVAPQDARPFQITHVA